MHQNLPRIFDRRRIFFLTSIAILTVSILFSKDILGRAREDVVFHFSPSAPRAYDYGNAHFRALNSREYDIERAEYWYEKSFELDPMLPGVNHQRARISFLRGNFKEAMMRINAEINLPGGPITASSYYIRGLIEGYMGDYDESAKDYERYLESDPHNWAALNDLAWVLLKGERFEEASAVTAQGVVYFPENPWLLNSSATALFELGRYEEALAQVQKAHAAVANLSQQLWLTAYPGNDPKIAEQGVAAFKKAVADNMHTIVMKVDKSRIQ